MNTINRNKRNFTITTDINFQDEKFGITPALHTQFNSIFRECQDKKDKRIIGKLTKLILQYPKTPQLKNYLSVAYSIRHNNEKAFEVNRWLVTEHPDYLFGKLNLANQYLEEKQFAKVVEVLGEEMEIQSLYPERDVFHLNELINFYKTTIRYFIAIDDLEKAEDRLEFLNLIAPDDPHTQQAQFSVMAMQMKKGAERLQKEADARISTKVTKTIPATNSSNRPEFHHSEIRQLYNYDLKIPREMLDAILVLPRETVIDDLENVLQDAIKRYTYFQNREYNEGQNGFPLHALFLIAELQSEKSLPCILDFLSYDSNFIDYWLADHVTETLWLVFYKLGQNSFEVLEQFLLQPGISTHAKTAVSTALQQMVLYHPEKRNEVADLYERVFSFFNNASYEDNLIDSDFLGFAIGDALDCGFSELLPIIKSLYEQGYVSEGINGPYEDVVKISEELLLNNPRKNIFSIQAMYAHILATWWGYNENKNINPKKVEVQPQLQPAKVVNVGRNELCPCGSGKKFKKCCLN